MVGTMGRRAVLRGTMGLVLAGPVGARGETLKADRIVVLKAQRQLLLYKGAGLLRSYPVALGGSPVGPKRHLGDGRTPEGSYLIDGRNSQSLYYLALHVSYPNEDDIARAEADGVDPGGDICVHGLPAGFERLDPRRFDNDWTRGCIAVSDRAISEIWDRVDDGTPIDILA